MVGQNKNDICRDVAVPHIYRIVDLYTTIIHIIDRPLTSAFHISQYQYPQTLKEFGDIDFHNLLNDLSINRHRPNLIMRYLKPL
jgi:hypothetical protein